MIAYLNGVVAKKSTGQLILDVSGVGYSVEISSQTLDKLPDEGSKLQLLIYHHFTDSDQRLFGFSEQKGEKSVRKIDHRKRNWAQTGADHFKRDAGR